MLAMHVIRNYGVPAPQKRGRGRAIRGITIAQMGEC